MSDSPSAALSAAFGSIDIYLFDQIARGRFDARRAVLDAGCGRGRNLIYFMAHGFDVYGVDASEEIVAYMRGMAARRGVADAEARFAVADLAALPFADASVDAVVCSAVLHFARDEAHFAAMVMDMRRVLRPGGLFFARLASTIGIEELLTPGAGRWHRLPDGSDRFLVDAPLLQDMTRRMGGTLLDPLKTTVVHATRAMTTWVVEV